MLNNLSQFVIIGNDGNLGNDCQYLRNEFADACRVKWVLVSENFIRDHAYRIQIGSFSDQPLLQHFSGHIRYRTSGLTLSSLTTGPGAVADVPHAQLTDGYQNLV